MKVSILNETYVPGTWQRVLVEISNLDETTRESLKSRISEISDALHGRHGYKRFNFLAAYLLEMSMIATAIGLACTSSMLLHLIATLFLAVALQPALKVTSGLMLGVRYSYAYLWHFEPRFKMMYGDYIACPRWRRLIFQFSGCVGTPFAMVIGMTLLQDAFFLFWLCALGLVAFSLMQLAAFIAAIMGVERVGSMMLRHLTTPAMLAFELRKTQN